jgi:hypothetical protein
MNSKHLLIASVLLCAAGFLLLDLGWHGSASITAAYPLAGASVQLCGSATGGYGLAGVASLALGMLTLIADTVSLLLFERGKRDHTERLVSQP